MSNVAINIAAEFTGKKAFDKAANSTKTLEQSASKLAKTFKRTFAVTAVLAFGRASLKAFSEDEAAAQRLSTAVSNLGYSFSQLHIAKFISELEQTSGIMDDQLRPAFQSLLTTTGSLTMSQKLLNDAIQISRGSGEELSTVASDLALAYTGNTKGLKKYYTGLTQAELKTKSFSDILEIMLKNSAGSAEAYLGTTAYKMNVLSVAAENAKEKIGAGLVDAFAKMGGGSTAEDAARVINNIATAILSVVSAIATGIGAITKLYQKLDAFVKDFSPIFGDSWNERNAKKVPVRSKSAAGTWKRMQEQKKGELEAIKRNKELKAIEAAKAASAAKLLKAKKDQAELDKLGLLLAKGEDIFNMDNIQIQAALTNQTEQLAKVTNQSQLLAIANDMTRLKIKQDIAALEKAISDGDVEAAKAAADRLNTDLKNLTVLQGQAIKLADINKILAGMVSKDLINLANLDIALQKIKDMYALLNGGKTPSGSPNLTQDDSGFWNVSSKATVDEMVKAADLNTQFLLDMAAANEALMATINANPVNIPQSVILQLQLSGGDEIAAAVANNLQNKSLSSGNQAYINRRTGGFE